MVREEQASTMMMMRTTSMVAEDMSPNNHWMVTLQKVFYPALATVGIPSNMVTFLIIWRRNCMLSRSSSYYLMAMSVADTSVLLTIVILEFSLKYLQQEPFWSHAPWCSLRDIVSYGASNASTWLVVVFTGERFVAIHNWRIKSRVCTARCAAWTIAAVFLLSHLLAVPHYWANVSVYVNNQTRCVYAEDGPYDPFIHALVWAQTVQAYILPFTIILLLNRLTLRQISLSNRVQSVQSATRGQHAGVTPLLRSRKRKSVLLLVTVSMTFVLLSVTRAVTQIILRTTNVGRPLGLDRNDYDLEINVAADIGTMLSLSNAAVNMYLYVCTQSRFRQELVACARQVFYHTETKASCLGHIRLK